MLVLSYKAPSSSKSHIQSANSYENSPNSSNQELTPYQIKLEKANQMRQNPTQAERRMWEILTSVMHKFPEYTFDTQSVQYGYILDFFCPTLNLAIEVDGSSHIDRRGADWERDMNLKRRGIEILRVNNEEVFNNPQGLTNSLCKIIQEIDPLAKGRNFSKIEENEVYREPYQPERYRRRSYPPRRY
jgi:very-short-patch-repair endonuclease